MTRSSSGAKKKIGKNIPEAKLKTVPRFHMPKRRGAIGSKSVIGVCCISFKNANAL